MIINAIVIDPNALQRMDTVKKSNDHESINLLAEFNSCIEANDFLINTDVDLIFLEVDMTKINGFEFLDILADFLGILAGSLFINFFKYLYPKY